MLLVAKASESRYAAWQADYFPETLHVAMGARAGEAVPFFSRFSQRWEYSLAPEDRRDTLTCPWGGFKDKRAQSGGKTSRKSGRRPPNKPRHAAPATRYVPVRGQADVGAARNELAPREAAQQQKHEGLSFRVCLEVQISTSPEGKLAKAISLASPG